jgi:hypothetical protein
MSLSSAGARASLAGEAYGTQVDLHTSDDGRSDSRPRTCLGLLPGWGGCLMLSGWWNWGGPAALPSSWLEIDLRA